MHDPKQAIVGVLCLYGRAQRIEVVADECQQLVCDIERLREHLQRVGTQDAITIAMMGMLDDRAARVTSATNRWTVECDGCCRTCKGARLEVWA